MSTLLVIFILPGLLDRVLSFPTHFRRQFSGNGRQRYVSTLSLGFDIGNPSDGAFYAYAGISAFSNDSLAFCERLLDQAGVAVTPGIDFDRAGGSRYVRFSYAGRRETIEMALERMAAFLR